jgi:glutamate dehydrogenase
LMAYTKIVLAREVLSSDLPDDSYLDQALINYFPTALRERYVAEIREHRLSREIITTVVVNDFVNRAGISCYYRLSSETGASPADVIRAHIAARAIFGAAELERAIIALDHQISAQMQTTLRLEVRTLVERATRWLVNNRRRPVDIRAAVDFYRDGVQAVAEQLPAIIHGRDKEAFERRAKGYRSAGVPDDLAGAVAIQPAVYPALTIVSTAQEHGLDVARAADLHFTLGQRLGLDRLLTRIVELPRDDRWQIMARAALRDDLHTVHAQLTAEVITGATDRLSARDLVTAWEKKTPGVIDSVKVLRSICDGRPDLAKMSVGLRLARTLLSRTG